VALRKAIKTINDTYIDTRPDAEKEAAKFELIIGVWTQLPNPGELQLLKSSGPALLSAGDYHCTGIGAYLGDYLMRNIFSPAMRIKDTALLAIQALAAAKAYDANCGGDTQFMTISVTGAVSRVIPYDIYSSEKYIADFEQMSRHRLFDIGNDDISETMFE
jgi:20S proteasome alpha/beta subunit